MLGRVNVTKFKCQIQCQLITPNHENILLLHNQTQCPRGG